MARNPVQFQKGISLSEFLKRYGPEDQCFDALYRGRWPKGLQCPHCGHDRACPLTHRKLPQCPRCRRQTSGTAGTLFASTRRALTVWFQALSLMTRDKKGGSCIALSYNAAWRMKHQRMQGRGERDRQPPLAGRIELDDAWPGGQRSGAKTGRGAPGKTPFLAAVETNDRGHPPRMKLTVVKGVRNVELPAGVRPHLCTHRRGLSDGLACVHAVTEAGGSHDPVGTAGGRASAQHPAVHWVNTILGNVKSALRSPYHSFRPQYAQRYLSEFEYRFHRRFHLPELIPRLAYVALRTPPMPEKLLKLGVA